MESYIDKAVIASREERHEVWLLTQRLTLDALNDETGFIHHQVFEPQTLLVAKDEPTFIAYANRRVSLPKSILRNTDYFRRIDNKFSLQLISTATGETIRQEWLPLQNIKADSLYSHLYSMIIDIVNKWEVEIMKGQLKITLHADVPDPRYERPVAADAGSNAGAATGSNASGKP